MGRPAVRPRRRPVATPDRAELISRATDEISILSGLLDAVAASPRQTDGRRLTWIAQQIDIRTTMIAEALS